MEAQRNKHESLITHHRNPSPSPPFFNYCFNKTASQRVHLVSSSALGLCTSRKSSSVSVGMGAQHYSQQQKQQQQQDIYVCNS